MTELTPALAQARKQQKLLFVQLGRDQCGNCQALRGYVRTGTLISDEDFVYTDLNCDNVEVNKQFQQKFHVRGNMLPFVAIADSNGVLLESRTGYGKLSDYAKLVESAKQKTGRKSSPPPAAANPLKALDSPGISVEDRTVFIVLGLLLLAWIATHLKNCFALLAGPFCATILLAGFGLISGCVFGILYSLIDCFTGVKLDNIDHQVLYNPLFLILQFGIILYSWYYQGFITGMLARYGEIFHAGAIACLQAGWVLSTSHHHAPHIAGYPQVTQYFPLICLALALPVILLCVLGGRAAKKGKELVALEEAKKKPRGKFSIKSDGQPPPPSSDAAPAK